MKARTTVEIIIETEFAKPDQSLDIPVTGKKKAHKTGRDGTRNHMIRPPFAWLFDNIPLNCTTRYLELLSKHQSRDPGWEVRCSNATADIIEVEWRFLFLAAITINYDEGTKQWHIFKPTAWNQTAVVKVDLIEAQKCDQSKGIDVTKLPAMQQKPRVSQGASMDFVATNWYVVFSSLSCLRGFLQG